MSESTPNPETRIALFQRREIRRTVHNNEWWFVVEDVVLALIDSRDAKQYIQRMKQRDPELKKGWVQIVHTLSVPTEGGPQTMLCANTEGIFRLVQSIPSPKAEPFKRGSPRSVTSAFRRSRTPSSEPGAPVLSTKPKATPTSGSKSECAPLPSVRS